MLFFNYYIAIIVEGEVSKYLKYFVRILCVFLLGISIFMAFNFNRGQGSSENHIIGDFIMDDSSDNEPTDEKKDFINSETYNELKRLHEKYSDVYAWIEVPGTKIDYPVLQHKTDDDFYLHHDMEGDKNIYGSIYTESINNKDFKDPNTVIYGHNMRDESMFGSLKWFEDKDFFDQHLDVIITTLEDVRIYRIVAEYRFTDDHLLKNQDMFTRQGITTYLKKIPEYVAESGGQMREDVERKEPIITLSSCASGDNSYRLLVQAVLERVVKVGQTGEKNG